MGNYNGNLVNAHLAELEKIRTQHEERLLDLFINKAGIETLASLEEKKSLEAKNKKE